MINKENLPGDFSTGKGIQLGQKQLVLDAVQMTKAPLLRKVEKDFLDLRCATQKTQ